MFVAVPTLVALTMLSCSSTGSRTPLAQAASETKAHLANQRKSQVTTGATIFIPRSVQISIRNNRVKPLGFAFVFSETG